MSLKLVNSHYGLFYILINTLPNYPEKGQSEAIYEGYLNDSR